MRDKKQPQPQQLEPQKQHEFVYENIVSFSDFNDVVEESHYVRVPGDWSVLVATIMGATPARYRDVNTVGGACITAVKNALQGFSFPYVFGGDGATMCVPEEHRLDAVDALLALRRVVVRNFKPLDIHIGSMFVKDIEREGAFVSVGRYEITAGMCIAVFRGGGIELTRQRLVHQVTMPETAAASMAQLSLEGLSCRWNRIPSKNGCIISLVVLGNPNKESSKDRKVYADVLRDVDGIISLQGKKHHNPIDMELARYKGFWDIVREESRFHSTMFSMEYWSRIVQIFFCVLIFKFKWLQHAFIDAPEYTDSIPTHADHLKFDDMLRMVLDCTQDQANAIEFMLADRYMHDKQLFYGIHFTSHSIMTCLVDNTSIGNHIHFVDGDSGGYAMAGQQLKRQMIKHFGNSVPIVTAGKERTSSRRQASSTRSLSLSLHRGTSTNKATSTLSRSTSLIPHQSLSNVYGPEDDKDDFEKDESPLNFGQSVLDTMQITKLTDGLIVDYATHNSLSAPPLTTSSSSTPSPTSTKQDPTTAQVLDDAKDDVSDIRYWSLGKGVSIDQGDSKPITPKRKKETTAVPDSRYNVFVTPASHDPQDEVTDDEIMTLLESGQLPHHRHNDYIHQKDATEARAAPSRPGEKAKVRKVLKYEQLAILEDGRAKSAANTTNSNSNSRSNNDNLKTEVNPALPHEFEKPRKEKKSKKDKSGKKKKSKHSKSSTKQHDDANYEESYSSIFSTDVSSVSTNNYLSSPVVLMESLSSM